SGQVVQTYTASGESCWFALNLDPDGKSLWSADFCSSNVYKFDIATGQQLLKFNTGTNGFSVFGLVIFGEKVVGGPSVLHATVGHHAVSLYWDTPPQTVDSFNIRRNDGTTVFTVNVPGNTDNYFDSGLEDGPLYTYTLVAVKN